ncbi:hypothetical protein PHYC_02898 [Phycisphaerales bacterium]|nr:hypothetical protein PHYC_02898 [Phycisphaerales bacterium]
MKCTLRWSIAVAAAAVMAGCSKQPGETKAPESTPARVIPIHVPYRADTGQSLGFTQSLRLPWNTIIQLGVHGRLEIEDEGKTNRIIGGEALLRLSELPKPGLERPIQVLNFNADDSTVLVQVDVSGGMKLTVLDAAVEKNDPAPTLTDTLGSNYQVIGFVYTDETTFKMQYGPGDPLKRFNQLPSMSRSRPKQKLVLIFRVSLGREVKSLNMGRVIYEFDSPIRCTMKQENRR